MITFLAQGVSVAKVYEGDGTYNLKVGDSVRATNGWRIELCFAGGQSPFPRSSWVTSFALYDPTGKMKDKISLNDNFALGKTSSASKFNDL